MYKHIYAACFTFLQLTVLYKSLVRLSVMLSLSQRAAVGETEEGEAEETVERKKGTKEERERKQQTVTNDGWEGRGCIGREIVLGGLSQLHMSRCRGNAVTMETTQYYHGHACAHVCFLSLPHRELGLVATAARSMGRGWQLGGCRVKLAYGRFNPASNSSHRSSVGIPSDSHH